MKYFTTPIYTLYIALSILIFNNISCKPTDKQSEEVNEKVNIRFSIQGIEEEQISIKASVPNSSLKEASKNFSTLQGSDFIIESGIEHTKSSSLNYKINKSSSVTPIPKDIRVRLLIYEVAQNGVETFKSNLGVPVQEDFFAITLEKNKNYKFYSYSYNSFTRYPPSPLDEDNPIIPTVNDNALILASGGISVLNDPVHINVLFRHVTSRISIAVDAQSFFATSITNLKVRLNKMPLTRHNLDLKNRLTCR